MREKRNHGEGNAALRDIVQEIAKPRLESMGFREARVSPGVQTFERPRTDGLVEAIIFAHGDTKNVFGVEIAILRPGANPFEALPATTRLSQRDRQRGLRDSLGRLVHGNRFFPERDGHVWRTDQDLRRWVAEDVDLALNYGPRYWDRHARRLTRQGIFASSHE